MSEAAFYESEAFQLERQVDQDISVLKGKRGAEKDELVFKINNKIDQCKKTIKSLEVEVRGMDVGPQKKEMQSKLTTHKEKLEKMRVDLKNAQSDKATLLGGDIEAQRHQEPEVDYNPHTHLSVQHTMDAAKSVSDQTKASALRAERIALETEQVGNETAKMLQDQTEMLNQVNAELDKLGVGLERAKRELLAFGRRMLRDRCILVMIFVVVALAVAAIVYAIVKKHTG